MKSVMVTILFVIILLGTGLAFPQGRVYVSQHEGAWDTTNSGAWEDVPNFFVEFDQEYPGNASIGVSAYVYSSNNARMFIRILVDNQAASPSDVVFNTNYDQYCHAFIFSANINSGHHVVRVQYLSDASGTASIADRSMWVVTSPDLFNTVAVPSGAFVSTTSTSYVDIPSMTYNITMPVNGDAVFMISGEGYTSGGKRMFIRPLIDSQGCEPGNVILITESNPNSHTFAFVARGLSAGSHNVQWQWLVDAGGTAYLGDRTFTIGIIDSDAHQAGNGGIYSISAPSGPDVSTVVSSWVPVPDLSGQIISPENGDAVILFNGEANTANSVFMFGRAVLDGSALEPHDVPITMSNFNGTCSMGFVQTGINQGSHTFGLEWYANPSGACYMGDRNITVITFSAPGTPVEEQEQGNRPSSFDLKQNYPNPFNPVTTIEYQLRESADVILYIYDLKGNYLKKYVQGRLTAGTHSIQWNGRNDSGHVVASGIYFYRIEAKTNEKTYVNVKKMIFIK